MKISAGGRVEPEKAQARADERAAEDRELRRRREADEQQVVRELTMAGDVGERGERRGRDGERTDRQAVEAVGQVDGVRRADQHEHGERHVQQAEVRDRCS